MNAPPRLTRAQSKLRTRAALLAAAEEELARRGYHGATLDGIAAAAGFTKGAVYAHFRNKEELFLELLAAGLERNGRGSAALLEQLGHDPARLDEELRRWFEAVELRDTSPLLALELDLESRRNPAFAARLDEVYRGHHDSIGAILDRYFDLSGREPALPVNELAQSILALRKGIAVARMQRADNAPSAISAICVLLGMPEAA